MLNAEVGVGDATHVMIHDIAHCDDLLIGDAHRTDPYVKIQFIPLSKLFIHTIRGILISSGI